MSKNDKRSARNSASARRVPTQRSVLSSTPAADISRTLLTNAAVYVDSLMHPFDVKGARIPESTPFPSTVGSYVNRFTSAGVPDAGLTPTKKISGMFFGIDPCINGTWTAQITGYTDAFVEEWTTAPHPYADEVSYVFQLVRTVSRGIRIINISTMLERGGALYVSYAAVRPTNGILADLRLAQETEVYDAARLTKDGLTCVYLPLTTMPLMPTGDNTIYLPGSSYVNPGSDHKNTSSLFDCNIFIWVEGSVDQDLTLEWEEVQNWEAIPWPIAESLFLRKAVMSSEDAKAAAMEAARPTRTATAQRSGTSGWDKFKASLATTAKSVGKFALEQLSSMAMGGLMALPSLLAAEDVHNHRLALCLHRPDLSPVNNASVRGMKRTAFREHAMNAMEVPVIVPSITGTASVVPVPNPTSSPLVGRSVPARR